MNITTYHAAMEAAEESLDKQWNAQRLRGDEYARVYTGVITAAMQLAAGSDLQLAQKQLVDAQKDEITGQTAAKLSLLNAQKETESAKKLLIDRQKESFGDNLRIEKAKITGNAIGMVHATGGVVDADKWADFSSKINAI